MTILTNRYLQKQNGSSEPLHDQMGKFTESVLARMKLTHHEAKI
jgi:hypothetical protein